METKITDARADFAGVVLCSVIGGVVVFLVNRFMPFDLGLGFGLLLIFWIGYGLAMIELTRSWTGSVCVLIGFAAGYGITSRLHGDLDCYLFGSVINWLVIEWGVYKGRKDAREYWGPSHDVLPQAVEPL